MIPRYREGDKVWMTWTLWDYTTETGSFIASGQVQSGYFLSRYRGGAYLLELRGERGHTKVAPDGLFHRQVNRTRAEARREVVLLRHLCATGITKVSGVVDLQARGTWCQMLRAALPHLRKKARRR